MKAMNIKMIIKRDNNVLQFVTPTVMTKLNRAKVERIKKYLLFVFAICLVIFYIVLHFRIQHTQKQVYAELTAFDGPLHGFETEFKRVRAYINRLADHYGCPSETNGLCGSGKDFNDSVIEYCKARTDVSFENITEMIKRITTAEMNNPKVLSHMVQMQSHPLTLSIFLLAPIPCKHLIPAQAALATDPRVMKDQLMLYLATLRQPNIFRIFFNIYTWIKMYDNAGEDGSSCLGFDQFGNVLSYENEEISVAGRLKQFIPELRIKSERLERIAWNSETAKLINAPHKFSLTVSIDDIIAAALRGEAGNLNSSVIVVKTHPKSIKYFTQISEKLNLKQPSFHLKAMIIEEESSASPPSILIFDKTFQVWTKFSEDGRILSMPRQIARLYYTLYGKYLIYGS